MTVTHISELQGRAHHARLSPNMSASLHDFDNALAAQGRAESTRRQYFSSLMRCEFDLGQDLLTVSTEDLLAYLATLSPNGGAKGNRHRALIAYFAWACPRLRPDNPARDIKVPHERAPKAPDITRPEVLVFLRAAFRALHRHHAWAVLLPFKTGIRVGSLVAIRAEDVTLEDRRPVWLEVRKAKAGRTYGIPLNRGAGVALAHLMEFGHDPLVPTTTNAVRAWFETASKAAWGEEKRLHPHDARHYAITQFARAAGSDVATVADLAGWSGISEYRRYVATSEARLRAAAETA